MIVRSRRTQLASSTARAHPRLWTLWLATSTGIPVAHSSEDAFAVLGERRNRVACLSATTMRSAGAQTSSAPIQTMRR